MLAWLPFVVASVSAALHSTNCRHIVGFGMAKKSRSEFFHFFQAGSADVFVLINLDVVGTVAEDTGGLILFKDDGVLVDIDFQRVPLGYAQGAPQLNGKNNAAEWIDLTYDSGGFHCDSPLLLNHGFHFIYANV